MAILDGLGSGGVLVGSLIVGHLLLESVLQVLELGLILVAHRLEGILGRGLLGHDVENLAGVDITKLLSLCGKAHHSCRDGKEHKSFKHV